MSLKKRLEEVEKITCNFPQMPSKVWTEEERAAFGKLSTEEKIADIMKPKTEEQRKQMEELHEKLKKLSTEEKIAVCMGRKEI